MCRRSLDAVRRARLTLDRARALLPAYIPYLEWEGAPEKDWEQAAAIARDLADRLDAPEPADASGALRRNDELARSADDLESYLDRLMLPFEAARLAELRDRLHRPYARPAVLAEAEAVLATPLAAPDERGPLWEATRALARRLDEEAARMDQTDDLRLHAAAQPPAPAPTDSSSPHSLVLRRARISLALLRLGGAAGLEPVQQALAHAEESAGDPATFGPAVEALADELRRAWADADSRVHDASQDAAVRERLSWVWLPAGPAADAIDGAPAPQAEMRRHDSRCLRTSGPTAPATKAATWPASAPCRNGWPTSTATRNTATPPAARKPRRSCPLTRPLWASQPRTPSPKPCWRSASPAPSRRESGRRCTSKCRPAGGST